MVVLDTNVLLLLYKFTASARVELFRAINRIGDRLFMPFQVAVEFHNKRIDIIDQQVKQYDVLSKALNTHKEQLFGTLNHFANTCKFTAAEKHDLTAGLDHALAKIHKQIAEHQAKYEFSVVGSLEGDSVLDELNPIFARYIGAQPTSEQRAVLEAQFDERAKESIPPGYRDADKEENRSGDYLIWEETIAEASRRKQDVLIVTDDGKDDWWRKSRTHSVGPNLQLVEELKERAGVRLMILDAAAFLEAAKSALSVHIDSNTIEQSRRVEEEAPERLIKRGEKEYWQKRHTEIILDIRRASSEEEDTRKHLDLLYEQSDLGDSNDRPVLLADIAVHEEALSVLRQRIGALYDQLTDVDEHFMDSSLSSRPKTSQKGAVMRAHRESQIRDAQIRRRRSEHARRVLEERSRLLNEGRESDT
ncbi:hypothetical protein Asera_20500 [Actinocatenispora sera]|uniref:PIN like domain-containing protein n=2 Tax=Actinocatenispora sera TaxID=390989 RepID=A0A810KZV3_9ACTN|nr:hypothetical protein Asera_20500 [Actinocatenispora sera]